MKIEIVVFNTDIEKTKELVKDYYYMVYPYTSKTKKFVLKISSHFMYAEINSLLYPVDFFILLYIHQTMWIKQFTKQGNIKIVRYDNLFYIEDARIDWELQENLNARHALNKLIGVYL